MSKMCVTVILGLAGAAFSETFDDVAEIASGWRGSIVAKVDQSYAGWDVEIGDADNDGKNEILTTGCPDSRLHLFKMDETNQWNVVCLADNLAEQRPGMGLAVRIVDLNGDGKKEIILGTGEDGAGGTAIFYVLGTDGAKITSRTVSRPTDCNKSSYTHSFGVCDLNKDGLQEVISAYCGGGEVIRYDVARDLASISARQLTKLSGSGEESIIADVDNDGAVEYLTSNGFRAGKARVEIFEFDKSGELIQPPRLTIPGYAPDGCFYASLIVGDLDNDQKNELIIGWKREQKVNKSTLMAYRVGESTRECYTLDYETEDLDMGYFEKMMAVADADNDGKNELVVSTRGDNKSEFITSNHLGNIFLYRIKDGKPEREHLLKFNTTKAESSWIAVGDADNDGKNEVVVATGFGDRTQPGESHVAILEKE